MCNERQCVGCKLQNLTHFSKSISPPILHELIEHTDTQNQHQAHQKRFDKYGHRKEGTHRLACTPLNTGITGLA